MVVKLDALRTPHLKKLEWKKKRDHWAESKSSYTDMPSPPAAANAKEEAEKRGKSARESADDLADATIRDYDASIKASEGGKKGWGTGFYNTKPNDGSVKSKLNGADDAAAQARSSAQGAKDEAKAGLHAAGNAVSG